MSIRDELREYIFSLPVIDTHAHLREYSSLPQPMSALALFNSSGNLRQMWVSSGALSVSEYRQMKQFQDWGELSAAIEKIKASGIYRILWKGLRDLYGLCAEELDEGSFSELSEKVCAAYSSPEWYRVVIRERAGVELTCQDSRGVSDRSLLTPVARFDEYVWFARADWRARVLQKHGAEKTATLDGLLRCLEEDFRNAVDSGAVAVKNNSTWCRRIDFDAVSLAEAERAFAECMGESSPGGQVEKSLGDYIMDHICELCAQYDIPLQLHTGPAGGTGHLVEWGNPLHLNGLIVRHPRTKFVLFHAGGPFSAECRDLAVQFPNCYLDLCGVMAVKGLRAILDDWIERVPHTKLMWGTDANIVEEVFALVDNFRGVLVDFLAKRVDEGYFSLRTAQDIARGILGGNARCVLRV